MLFERFDTEEHDWLERDAAVCMVVVRSSSVASPKFWGSQILWLQASNNIFSGHCLSKHKMTRYVENFGGMDPLDPMATPVITRKEWKRKNSNYLMSSLPLTKNSQQRKTARYCRTPMKSNIIIIGFCVWLLPTRLSANRNCLLKVCMLVESARTFLVSFTLKNVSTLGLLQVIIWGCCNDTLPCKTCLHAVYYRPMA